MFGDNNDQQHNDNVVEPTADGALTHNDNGGNMGAPAVPTPPSPPHDSAGDYLMDDLPGAQPAAASSPPAADDVATDALPATPAASPVPAPSMGTDDLLSIKQQALTQLTPLVDHLEQDPEEKFRTTMMMIQASDNDELIKTAYEAAQKITDDKARAQALLDIVNEINYFTQNTAGNAGTPAAAA